MNTSTAKSSSRRRIAHLATIIIGFTASCAVSMWAQAPEAPPASPAALLQNATLNGTGNTFAATYLPVITSNGTIYVDLTVQFAVDANGNVTVSSVQQVPAPTPINGDFVPGTYLGPDSSTELISVSGPGVTQGGSTEWSLAPASGAAGCLYPNSATWFVGPIKSNPLYARIKKAGIPTGGNILFFGVGGSNCNVADWQTDSLLGFAETGKQITIESFTQSGVDHNSSVDQKSYTLQPPQ
jgi:hypothetical protein